MRLIAEAELNGELEMRGYGLTVQEGGLITPFAQGVHGGLAEESVAGNNFHGADMAGGLNERIHNHVTGDVLGAGSERKVRRNGSNEPRGAC